MGSASSGSKSNSGSVRLMEESDGEDHSTEEDDDEEQREKTFWEMSISNEARYKLEMKRLYLLELEELFVNSRGGIHSEYTYSNFRGNELKVKR